MRRTVRTGLGLALAVIASAVPVSIAGAAPAAPAGKPAEAAELGPALGAPIPHDLALPDPDGVVAPISARMGPRGAAVFFVRSLDWCPYCKAQAVDVSARLSEFTALGLSVVFVSYDSPARQAAFVQRTAFAPVLLSDDGSRAIRAFGLLNGTVAEDSRFYGIPHPAVFILDREGVVRAKLYEADFLTNDKSYRNRPAVDRILEAATLSLAD